MKGWRGGGEVDGGISFVRVIRSEARISFTAAASFFKRRSVATLATVKSSARLSKWQPSDGEKKILDFLKVIVVIFLSKVDPSTSFLRSIQMTICCFGQCDAQKERRHGPERGCWPLLVIFPNVKQVCFVLLADRWSQTACLDAPFGTNNRVSRWDVPKGELAQNCLLLLCFRENSKNYSATAFPSPRQATRSTEKRERRRIISLH